MKTTPDSPRTMQLRSFLPYRLAVVAEAVSREVSKVYTSKYELSRDEWRVLAALGETGAVSTQAALLYTTLDKVQVSRALARLETKGLLERSELPDDRRNRAIALTTAGKSMYRRLVPQVKAVEAALFDSLGPKQLDALNSALDSLIGSLRQNSEPEK